MRAPSGVSAVEQVPPAVGASGAKPSSHGGAQERTRAAEGGAERAITRRRLVWAARR